MTVLFVMECIPGKERLLFQIELASSNYGVM